MPEEIKDQNIEIANKTIGFSSIIRLNVKTVLWIFGILYIILGALYVDQRIKINKASTILQSEKQDFLNGVQATFYKDIGDIKVGMESIKGDVKLILDRQSRENPVSRSNVYVHPTNPPVLSTTTSPPDNP